MDSSSGTAGPLLLVATWRLPLLLKLLLVLAGSRVLPIARGPWLGPVRSDAAGGLLALAAAGGTCEPVLPGVLLGEVTGGLEDSCR